MQLIDEIPAGLTIRLPDQFERQAAQEKWEPVDWLNAGRWLTRLRDEYGVYELVPLVDGSGVVSLQAFSRTLATETVALRPDPAWPLLQALADLWFSFAAGKVNRAGAPAG